MLGPRATCGVTRDTPPCGPFCVLCSRPHPAVSTIVSPVRNSWRSAASGPPVEAEQLRFVSPYENVARCAACPEWSDVVVGVRDSAGNKGGPFHPGCQRPRGPRDLGARHPHSPPTAPDQGSLASTPLLASRAFGAQRQKRGENPCPSLSFDLVRVDGMRPEAANLGRAKGFAQRHTSLRA